MGTGDRTLYAVLGCDEAATPTELKTAWRKRLLQVHPDHGGSVPDTLEVQAAYDVLSDERKRRAYDDELAGARRPTADRGPTSTDDWVADMAQRFADAFVQGFADGMRSWVTGETADDWDDDDPDDVGWPRRRYSSGRHSDQDMYQWAKATAGRAGLRLCSATTKKGWPCGASARSGSDYCYAHDPNRRLCAGFSGSSGTRPCRATAIAGQPYCYWHATMYRNDQRPGTSRRPSPNTPTVAARQPSYCTCIQSGPTTTATSAPSQAPLATVGAVVTGFGVFFLGCLSFVVAGLWVMGEFRGEDGDVSRRIATAMSLALVNVAVLGRLVSAAGRALAADDAGARWAERLVFAPLALLLSAGVAFVLYRQLPDPTAVPMNLGLGVVLLVCLRAVGSYRR